MSGKRPTIWKLVRRDKVALVCLAVLGVMALAALAGSWLTGYGYETTGDSQFALPSAKHWCGTDLHGRDVLTRVLFGAQISLAVGVIGSLASLVVGVSYGMVSGYWGGKVDNLMMRLVDILYSLPRIIIVIVLIVSFDKLLRGWFEAWQMPWLERQTRIVLLFIGLGVVEWLTMARIVRGQVLALKEQQFVLAARALGASHASILLRHLLPNLAGVIVVYLTLTIPVVILTESFLSFLGLGIQPPQASWGTLIADGAAVINPVRIYWWLLVFPGLAMGVTLLCLNLLGDRMRDILDPRQLKK
ncbi:MAG: ABC transporter permease [Verrucomicrobiae bacterium]|nr:ABC transporter permease [Verrucomicrobiae bacterium]